MTTSFKDLGYQDKNYITINNISAAYESDKSLKDFHL